MDFFDILRSVGALAAVLGLIAGAVFLARRFGLVAGAEGGQFAARRLGIVESLSLDPRRRLVLVRRDGAEHLLLLGDNREMLIETRAAPMAHEAFAGVSVYGTSFRGEETGPRPYERAAP
ncbi:MAG: flagellar biosynthetic protein FliO [Alphaproteobacteria bacterium]|nr:flagellar biosynthetic protein FliO [Alphaproteobacteria bacterium]